MKKQVDNQKSKIDSLTLSNKDLEVELKEKIDKISTLHDQNQKATYQIQDLERQLDQERTALKEMTAQHEFELKEKDKANELLKLQSQLEETQMPDQLEERDKIITDLKDKMAKYLEEFQAKERELYEKEIKISNLSHIGEKCEILQTENTQMRSQIQQKDDRAEELEGELKRVQLKLQGLEER